MSKLNVLLVSYVFPPIGAVGAMRPASFARYFPAEGIQLDVLTARNASTVGTDLSALKEIPDSVVVHRTLTLDLPFGIKKAIKRLVVGRKPAVDAGAAASQRGEAGLLKRILGNIFLPDPQVTWYPVLMRAAPRIVKERKIDVVLITVPTYSTLLLVERLRKAFPRLPVVIDFRDEWLTTAFENVSFLFTRGDRARRLASKIEASAVTNASAVVAVTEAARRQMLARYPDQPPGKFHLVPNGFDSTRLRLSAPAPRSGNKIVVTYVGTVYTTTEPTALIEAFELLPPDLKARFLFRFIGHVEEPRFRESILRLGESVELINFMPQREALALMDETDYALLVTHDPLNVSGKFYDYIGSGKPILAIVHPDGDARRLLEELRAGWWAPVQDVEAIRKLLVDAAERGKAPFSDFKPDTQKIAQYERKVLAQRYAALLHSIAGSASGKNAEEPATLSLEGTPRHV